MQELLKEKNIEGYILRPIQQSEENKLQKLFEDCRDYFLLAEQREPSSDEAFKFFSELPDKKTLEDKFLLGFYDDKDVLIGMIDLIQNYPDIGNVYVGLFLLEPSYRGTGLGRKLFAGIEEVLNNIGNHTIALSVESNNNNAIEFWKKIGFIEYKREVKQAGDITHDMIYFKK